MKLSQLEELAEKLPSLRSIAQDVEAKCLEVTVVDGVDDNPGICVCLMGKHGLESPVLPLT